MLDKVESFIKRLRWKAFYFDKKQLNQDEKPLNTYGFRSEKTPPTNNDLIRYENDLYELIRNLRYRKVTNNFQKNLLKDIASLNSSQNIIVPADKTTNLYGVEIDNYKKLFRDNITATYQKTEDSTVAKINKEAKAIASKLKLDDRIERFPTRKAFITLKDHKPNFVNNPKCRLINPAKSKIGMISKKCLDKINKVIRSKTNLH